MAERLVLIGMMGAGKTTVGRLAAARLGWRFLDSDLQVAEETGRTVPELLARGGRAGVPRPRSRGCWQRRSRSTNRSSCRRRAGWCWPRRTADCSRDAGTVVWLRAELGTLSERVGDGAGRPLLDGDPAAALAGLDEVRRPLYASVASSVVDVDGSTPEEVVDRVLADLVGEVERDRSRPDAAARTGRDEPRR